MKEIPIKLGPLALLLTVISICLTTMAILTFSTARADMRLAEKYADTVKERYALEMEGQEYLRQTSDDIAQGILLLPDRDGLVREIIEQGNSRLHIAIQPNEQTGYTLKVWRVERQWIENTDIGNLWDGSFH